MGAIPRQLSERPGTLSVRGIDAFRALPGVEAVFRSRDGRVFFAVAREHDAVDWDQVLEIERQIREAGQPEVTISVRPIRAATLA